MAHTYDELKAKTIAELRDIAHGMTDERVQGYSQMNKDHLLPAICAALGIDTHEHHAVVGVDKAGIKAKMRTLKTQRDEALEAHDHDRLKSIRRQLHSMNHQLRSHMR
jgi:DNA-binding IclR family transcriptional regulator